MSFSAHSLRQLLADAQRLGSLGDRPIDEVIEHSRQFVRALPPHSVRILDLGTGGGVPGLVIAHDVPESHIVLLDRRENRMDTLRRAVSAAQLDPRVMVVCSEAEAAARKAEFARTFDAVVARGFGPPFETARCAAPFLRANGVLIVSEPPESDGSRWNSSEITGLGFGSAEVLPGVVRLEKRPF